MISIRSVRLFVALALLPACSNSGGAGEADEPDRGDRSSAGEEGERPAPAKTPAKAPTAGTNYQITATPQGPFKVGGDARVDVRLTGRNGYHVNQEYPIKLRLDPTQGVKLTKTTMVRADASAFEEAQAVFPVGVTPETAGRKALHGTLSFSVCNPQNCLLERQDVSAEFEAQP